MKEVIMWTITDNKSWAHLEERYDWVRDMQHVPQDPIHHAEGNVAIHTQLVLEALQEQAAYQALSAQDQEILWAAALLHDVEKRSTTIIEPDGRITSAGHARRGEGTARQILYGEIATPFHIREQIAKLVRFHSLPLWLLERRDPLHTIINAALQVNTAHLALLARADMLGRIAADKEDMLYRIDCFEEYCKEHQCRGTSWPFENAAARMHYLQKGDDAPGYVPYHSPAVKVVIMSGLPGAGKDTYVQQHFKQPDWEIVSLDEIRVKMKISPTDKSGNGTVVQVAKEQARVCLRNKRSFVWNATNTTHQMREQLIALCLQYDAHVTVVYVEVPYKELFRQNGGREAIVPAPVMHKLIGKLEIPDLTEAHEVVYHVR
ncbi:Predicted kinase [Chitinophaga sp. YR627]|uniref:AAA family ATPase n=1 Tax=Chitinophaga sp. YR627 TaxID=1881041 RepID=UPI0008ED89AE|nr:AAA family ATPase [Chitinophaga sp. YR627]SFO57496.1 Predicted kinase [Chitinophaga sp. YR627]